MIRGFLLFSLLFSGIGVNAKDLPMPQRLSPLVSITIKHNGHFEDYPTTFEIEGVCKDFVLSPAEIRVFFNEARLIPRQDKKLDIHREESRCQVLGHATLQNGRSVEFKITRTGYAYVQYDSFLASTDGADYFCDTCGNKFYPAMGKKLPDFRPVIKSFTIEENPIDLEADSQTEENRCGDFSLSAEDVREFFSKMRPISNMIYTNVFDITPCWVKGRMVLQDGSEGSWSIDTQGRGVMNIAGKGGFYCYCPDCNPEKFGEPCDLECRIDP